jgi:hypothetical protein
VSYQDPGWRPALKGIVFGLIPWAGHSLARKAGRNTLEAARAVYASVFVVPIFISLVVPFTANGGDVSDPVVGVAVTAGAGMGALAAVVWTRRRPLAASSAQALAQSYLTNMVLGIAFAENPVLIGYVCIFIFGSVWSYVVGVTIGYIGLLLIAPTRSDIERRQAEIHGSTLLLGRALVETPPATGRGWRGAA